MKTRYQRLQMAAAAFHDRKQIYPEGERQMLDKTMLKTILDKFAPGVDVAGDGVYEIEWLSTETFYRHTEEYVVPEQKPAYKYALEHAFPNRKGVL